MAKAKRQKDKQRSTKHYTETKDCATRTPQKTITDVNTMILINYQQTKYKLTKMLCFLPVVFFSFVYYILTQSTCFQCYLLIPDFRLSEGIFT